MQGIAGNELRSFADEMTKVTNTLANSKTQIEGFGEAYTKQLALIDRGFSEQLVTINSSMDDWVKNLDQNFKKTSVEFRIEIV